MKNKYPFPVALAAIVCLLALLIMVATLTFGKPQINQVFTPPAFDTAAKQGTPTVPENLGWQELDAQAFKVAVCGEVIITDSAADIWLTSPESNTVWLKLRVLDSNGNILGETGLIKPGQYVRCVSLNSIPDDPSVILKIMAYEPDTYHSAGSISLCTKSS